MNENEDTSSESVPSEKLIDETLKMDRLLYLKTIQEKKSSKSLEMTRMILARKNNIEPEQVKSKEINKNNPNINKRLRDMANLGILDDNDGEYLLSPIGFLIIDELERLMSNIDIVRKHRWFFGTHDHTVIPERLFREIYKLRYAEQCKDSIDYSSIIEENTARTDHKIRIATDRLHDIPTWMLPELRAGNIMIQFVYFFKEPFRINSDRVDEERLWRELTLQNLPKGEFRYLTLEDMNPIGIRIINEHWALFNLYEKAEERLNRSISFYGTHGQFVSWIEDIFSSIWNRAKPLDTSRLLVAETR